MQTYPLLPVDLLRNKIFSLSLLTSVFSFIAQMLALVSIPFFFQRVLHLSEVATGLLLTPWPLATMITAPLAGRLMDRYNAGLLGGDRIDDIRYGSFVVGDDACTSFTYRYYLAYVFRRYRFRSLYYPQQ